MTHREEWEEKSFQVFTDEGGVLRSGWYPTGEGLVQGGVQVDRVWGNIPMQPNDDRDYDEFYFGGGSGDNGWDGIWTASSDTLQQGTLENNDGVGNLFDIVPEIGTDHINVTTGYSNFPAYIPNYAGDDDSGLETIIPNLVRKTRNQAEDLLDAANLDWFDADHDLEIQYIESTGKTVRVYAYNESWNNWGGYAGAELNGLRVGDEVVIRSYFDVTDYDWDNVKVTAISLDEEDSWFEFEVAETISPAIDTSIDSGEVTAGTNLIDVITLQRSNHSAGTIVDEGFNVHYRYFTYLD